MDNSPVAPPDPGTVTSVIPESKPVARWRSALALLILTAYPFLLPGIAWLLENAGFRASSGDTLLPEDLPGLMLAMGENLVVFGVWFAVAWWVGRPTLAHLHAQPVLLGPALLRGFGWSVALRLALTVLLALVLLVMFLTQGLKGLNSHTLEGLRPRVENLVPLHSLRNPWYLGANLTLTSFILAGLREELWRAGMIAAFLSIFSPKLGRRGPKFAGVFLTSIVFGLAHLPQGWGGVALTGLLGLGLGGILLFHRSLWIAVLAHGFFDATTFGALGLLEYLGLLDSALKA